MIKSNRNLPVEVALVPSVVGEYDELAWMDESPHHVLSVPSPFWVAYLDNFKDIMLIQCEIKLFDFSIPEKKMCFE